MIGAYNKVTILPKKQNCGFKNVLINTLNLVICICNMYVIKQSLILKLFYLGTFVNYLNSICLLGLTELRFGNY